MGDRGQIINDTKIQNTKRPERSEGSKFKISWSLGVLLLGAVIVLLPLVVVLLTSFAPPGATPSVFPKNG